MLEYGVQKTIDMTMNKGWWIAFGGLCSFIAAGILYGIAKPPRGEPIQLLPAPTQPPYEIYVVGAVLQPGVYQLPPGSRVEDAIQSAGGMQKEADPEAINLAALLFDGDRIRVPTQKVPAQTPVGTKPPATSSVTLAPLATTGPVDINTATVDELDTLPGIGPAIAGRIITYRQAYGSFKTIQDLLKVEGIGLSIFSKIKERITVGP
jgi:competence protein ComEA